MIKLFTIFLGVLITTPLSSSMIDITEKTILEVLEKPLIDNSLEATYGEITSGGVIISKKLPSLNSLNFMLRNSVNHPISLLFVMDMSVVNSVDNWRIDKLLLRWIILTFPELTKSWVAVDMSKLNEVQAMFYISTFIKEIKLGTPDEIHISHNRALMSVDLLLDAEENWKGSGLEIAIKTVFYYLYKVVKAGVKSVESVFTGGSPMQVPITSANSIQTKNGDTTTTQTNTKTDGNSNSFVFKLNTASVSEAFFSVVDDLVNYYESSQKETLTRRMLWLNSIKAILLTNELGLRFILAELLVAVNEYNEINNFLANSQTTRKYWTSRCLKNTMKYVDKNPHPPLTESRKLCKTDNQKLIIGDEVFRYFATKIPALTFPESMIIPETIRNAQNGDNLMKKLSIGLGSVIVTFDDSHCKMFGSSNKYMFYHNGKLFELIKESVSLDGFPEKLSINLGALKNGVRVNPTMSDQSIEFDGKVFKKIKNMIDLGDLLSFLMKKDKNDSIKRYMEFIKSNVDKLTNFHNILRITSEKPQELMKDNMNVDIIIQSVVNPRVRMAQLWISDKPPCRLFGEGSLIISYVKHNLNKYIQSTDPVFYFQGDKDVSFDSTNFDIVET
jgi:hypothetical protein